MNYPSLSLSAESIEKAFSGRKTPAPQNRSLTKSVTQSAKNLPEPQSKSNFRNGETKNCDNCDYKAATYEDMFDHVSKTHSRQGIRHRCPHCDFSNKIPARIKQHVYEVHLKTGSMKKCDECDYENVKGSNLYVHKRQHHMKQLKQKCSECDNTYHYPSTLKKHFKQVHLKIRRKQNGGTRTKLFAERKIASTLNKNTAKKWKFTNCLPVTNVHSPIKGRIR